MMTKSKLLVCDAIDDLDCTPEERSDIFEHMRDADITHVNGASHAREIAEGWLQMIRDANAEDNAEPKWQRAYYASSGCKAVDCMRQARWWMEVEAVPGIKFIIRACDKHAGKETEETE